MPGPPGLMAPSQGKSSREGLEKEGLPRSWAQVDGEGVVTVVVEVLVRMEVSVVIVVLMEQDSVTVVPGSVIVTSGRVMVDAAGQLDSMADADSVTVSVVVSVEAAGQAEMPVGSEVFDVDDTPGHELGTDEDALDHELGAAVVRKREHALLSLRTGPSGPAQLCVAHVGSAPVAVGATVVSRIMEQSEDASTARVGFRNAPRQSLPHPVD